MAVRAGEFVERVGVARVTGGYFATLGIGAAFGRTIAEGDATAAPVAVISDQMWRRAFDASPAVLGATLVVNGESRTIVGVAPSGFRGIDLGQPADVWTALVPPPDAPSERGNRGLTVMARLRRGSSIADAQAQLTTLAARLSRDYPKTVRRDMRQVNRDVACAWRWARSLATCCCSSSAMGLAWPPWGSARERSSRDSRNAGPLDAVRRTAPACAHVWRRGADPFVDRHARGVRPCATRSANEIRRER